MHRKEIINELNLDVELDKDSTVKTIVIQDTIWAGIVECRTFISDGRVYAAMYENDKKLTQYELVPTKQENK